MNIIVKSIPNTITCCNLVSGCMAIAMAFHTPMQLSWGLYGWQWAAIFILAAAVFDFLDGLAARTLHAYSDLGKELDSLSDLVSFGVAPAMMLYNVLECLHGASPWHWLTFFIPAMGALRLARFNVKDAAGDNSVFHGLPIPANALFWLGYISWMWNYGCPDDYVIAIVVAIVSLAMVSDITLASLKFKNLGLRDNWQRFTILLAAVVLCVLYGLSGLMWTILLYILMSVVAPLKAHKD